MGRLEEPLAVAGAGGAPCVEAAARRAQRRPLVVLGHLPLAGDCEELLDAPQHLGQPGGPIRGVGVPRRRVLEDGVHHHLVAHHSLHRLHQQRRQRDVVPRRDLVRRPLRLVGPHVLLRARDEAREGGAALLQRPQLLRVLRVHLHVRAAAADDDLEESVARQRRREVRGATRLAQPREQLGVHAKDGAKLRQVGRQLVLEERRRRGRLVVAVQQCGARVAGRHAQRGRRSVRRGSRRRGDVSRGDERSGGSRCGRVLVGWDREQRGAAPAELSERCSKEVLREGGGFGCSSFRSARSIRGGGRGCSTSGRSGKQRVGKVRLQQLELGDIGTLGGTQLG